MNQTCRYDHCPGGMNCYCELEREAAAEVRQSMQMLTYVLVYAAVMAAVIGIFWIL